MRMFVIIFPLVVASSDYQNEQTSRSPLLRGLRLRSIVAPKDQLDGKRKLATIKEGFFEDVISSSEEQRTKWSLCGNQYCMEKQYCTAAKECICQDGYESDGGQGCQDVDECASDNYPCPGTRNIESFCENRDPDNSYYKCGCNPGYAALLPEAYNETETGIPISFRPESCEATPLVLSIVLRMAISADDDRTIEEFVKIYEQELLAFLKSSINIQSYFSFSANIDSASLEVSLVDIKIHSVIEESAENSVSENGSSRKTQETTGKNVVKTFHLDTTIILQLRYQLNKNGKITFVSTGDFCDIHKCQIDEVLKYQTLYNQANAHMKKSVNDLKRTFDTVGAELEVNQLVSSVGNLFLYDYIHKLEMLLAPSPNNEVIDLLEPNVVVPSPPPEIQFEERVPTVAPSPPPSDRRFRKLAERMNEYYTISHRVTGQTKSA